MTHTYIDGVAHISLLILKPAGPTKPLVIVSLRRGSRYGGLSGSASGEKVRRNVRGALSASQIISKNSFLDLGREDIGARMSVVGGRADIDFGRLEVCS